MLLMPQTKQEGKPSSIFGHLQGEGASSSQPEPAVEAGERNAA